MRTRHLVLAASLLLFFTFQNCAPVAFDSTELLNDGFNRPVEPKFVEMKAGPDQQFPPLKLVFVVDNSGTMGVNQINLSKAFEKMFEGDNASNLGPFESNAILINTAQASVTKNDPILARLPAQSVDEIADMSFPTLMSTYRQQILDGSVPGDLVGYRLQKSTTNGLTSLEYSPAPIAGFASSGAKSRASLMVHLARNGNIEDFKTQFRERLALLDPARSKTVTNNGVTSGILDPIVDKESGLCAVARTLKKNEGLINPGELAAFVIVTDEDDADPSGLRCLEAIRDQSGADDLYDGSCMRPQTKLSYQAPIANPMQPKCNATYRKGFNYSYSYPVSRTAVTYYREKYFYKIPRTALSYYVPAGYDYDEESTPVTYYTSAPTYQVPRTTITYYTEVESCVIRDNIKTNCTYTYPSSNVTVDGDYKGNCATFVSGKIPATASSKPGYLPTCVAATPVNKSGACTTADTDKINCNQNYSPVQTTTIAGRPGTGGCSAFVSGKLPANALLTTTGAYAYACQATTVTPKSSTTGSCPATGLVNCRNRALAQKNSTVDNTFASPTTCAQFITSSDSSAVTNNASYPFSCTAAAPSAETSKYGVCPTTNINVIDCRRQPELATVKNFDGTFTAGQCVTFAAAQTGYSSNAILTAGPYEPTCAATSDRTVGPVSDSFLFTDVRYTNFTVNKGDACPQALKDAQAAQGHNTTSCTIGDPLTGSQTFDNVTCAEADVAGICTASGGTKKNCTGSDVAAGSVWNTNTPSVTYDGSFTCDTLCSETTFCKDKTGTVGDNFHACSTTSQGNKVISTFTAAKNPTCAAGDLKLTTNGPYHTTSTVQYPVVDKPTTGTDKLSEYIKSRSTELFGESTPFVSVFARQPGDSLGTNGSIGEAYNRFAESMGGTKFSVLSDADGYASALKGLSTMIRERLGRSFSIGVMAPSDQVRRVWHRAAGASSWGKPVDDSLWSSSGQTLQLSKDFPLEYGDEFRIEYW